MHNTEMNNLTEFWYTLPENWNFSNPTKLIPTKLWFYKDSYVGAGQWRLAYQNEYGWNQHVFHDANLFSTEKDCQELCDIVNATIINFNGAM